VYFPPEKQKTRSRSGRGRMQIQRILSRSRICSQTTKSLTKKLGKAKKAEIIFGCEADARHKKFSLEFFIILAHYIGDYKR